MFGKDFKELLRLMCPLHLKGPLRQKKEVPIGSQYLFL